MPRINPGKRLTVKEITKNIPIGEGWFTKEAVTNGELGKLINAVSLPLGNLLNEISANRTSLYLKQATGSDLDLWGLDLAVPRDFEEPDNVYRARLLNQLTGGKLTKEIITQFLVDTFDFDVAIYEPWRDLDWRSQNQGLTLPNGTNRKAGRSGSTRRSSLYYTAGVIDVVTGDYSRDLPKIVNALKAANVKVYYTPSIKADKVEMGDNLLVASQTTRHIISYTTPYNNLPEYVGYGQRRSGKRIINSAYCYAYKIKSTGATTQRLWDDPFQNHGSFRYTSLTWDTVGDMTWNELLEGHERQVMSRTQQYSITTDTTTEV
jgi:hypothetical protein